MNNDTLFHAYYKDWINIYKDGAIRAVTMKKYQMAQRWLEQLVPNLKIKDLNRIAYQNLLNEYAKTHASILLFAGVSMASVARRLGHSNMTTTQKTYLHIIQELENKDIDLIRISI